MAINPSQNGSALNDPTKRANEINDPQFANQQGYFPYDLTHQEFVTPRFGEVTPSMHLDTAPADRFVVHDNAKTIHTQINGNFLSTVNQYTDSFFVPLRSLYPTNYEKLIPNPTKGDDLPNMALPQFAIREFVYSYLMCPRVHIAETTSTTSEFSYAGLLQGTSTLNVATRSALLSRVLMLATVFSRGQLLDYLGYALDNKTIDANLSGLQSIIDNFFDALWAVCFNVPLSNVEITDDLNQDLVSYVGRSRDFTFNRLDDFRDFIMTSLEQGKYIYFNGDVSAIDTYITSFVNELLNNVFAISSETPSFVQFVNTSSNPFNIGFINLSKILAYQQVIAQYYTNDTVDNIFNSELYMQLLRGIMFPSDSSGFSKEPTFDYNGVPTEYDYISCGATYYSLIRNSAGVTSRQYLWLSTMMLLRRSLRYGDYFSTARPNMLAVGQLSIDVTNNAVSPIDVTKNLLMQRYLNAVNYIGSGFLQYFASIYGVTPSDTGTYPRFISHRKVPLVSDVVTNTASDQGKQVTNLVGYTDDNAFDVFIDDIGVVLSLISYDVLPVYQSGIDSSFHFADRFDYFNPMLQNIGDQSIRLSELFGNPSFREDVFGYTMRNAEYKYKISKCHGAFVNSLHGFLLKYPYFNYRNNSGELDHIGPDFIRDKPRYMDSVVSSMTGTSPANYYHFIVSVTNQVQCARKIQATPPVLF